MIKIAHAYDNLLNLYGSWANCAVLERYLSEAGYEVRLSSFTIGEYIDLSSFDLVYFGAATERRMLLAVNDFRRYLTELKEFIDDDRILFVTGNSMAIFGNTITDKDGMKYQATSLFNFDATIHTKRRYSELILTSQLTDMPVIGNINSSMDISLGNETPMFHVVKETQGRRKVEGVQKNHLYVTEVSGPILVRNPYLLHSFAEIVAGKTLPLSVSGWFTNATKGYQTQLLKLKKELKVNG